MIGKLQGIIDFIGDDFMLLMVGGVGYKVFVPASVQSATLGDRMSLWIETIVREDSLRLFGFQTLAQQELFNKLTSVSGVGPKVGMALLGTLKTDVLLSAIATGDVKTIATAPGVGKKMAEKIIVELKGKAVGAYENTPDTTADGRANSHSPLQDLLAALESLGYRRTDVVELAQRLVKENPSADVGLLVRLALKEITK